MSRTDNGGSRVWPTTCPICGKRYRLTNFMRLPNEAQWAKRGSRRTKSYRTTDSILVDDTHILACDRKRQKPEVGTNGFIERAYGEMGQ